MALDSWRWFVCGQVLAQVFGAEAACVRPQFQSGTHAIACALFGAAQTFSTYCRIESTLRPPLWQSLQLQLRKVEPDLCERRYISSCAHWARCSKRCLVSSPARCPIVYPALASRRCLPCWLWVCRRSAAGTGGAGGLGRALRHARGSVWPEVQRRCGVVSQRLQHRLPAGDC